MNKIIAFFSNKYVSVIILLLSLVARIINVLFVSYYGRDKMIVVLQSKSLLNGKGLGIPQYFTSDTATPVYDYTPFWPPGYSILLAPFLKLFNYNIYWATTTLDIIVSILLIFIIRRICKQLGLPVAAINMMTLITGCFEYTFINESLPTDTISVVAFLIGLSILIKTCVTEHFSIRQVTLTAFLLFLPCFFRYSYPAISVAVIIGLLLIAYVKNDLLLKRKGWWLLALNCVFIIIFFLLLKLTTGQAGYATPTERGLFPKNIVHWFPFIPSAFINIAFFTSQASHLGRLSFKSSMQLLEIINIISSIALLSVFINALCRKKTYESIHPKKLFFILGTFASLGLFALLGYMSLTYKMQMGTANNWNYIYESRYFAFAVLFIQTGLVTWLFSNDTRNLPKTPVTKTIATICLFTLLVEITHNIYFHTKVAFDFKKYKSAVYREQDYSYYISLIEGIKNKYPGYEIWAAASGDNFYQYLATYHGYTGIADPDSFKNDTLTIKKKTILLLMLYDHVVKDYQTFLSSHTILESKKIFNSDFYIIELKP